MFTSWPADTIVNQTANTAADNHVYTMASRHYSQPQSRHCSRHCTIVNQTADNHVYIRAIRGGDWLGRGAFQDLLQYATLHHLLPIVNAEVPQPAAGPGNAFKIKAVIKPKTVSDLGSSR